MGTEKKKSSPKLPKELSGAKPRYSYGLKRFELEFESDVDRAAYITAQKSPSKRDAEYVRFVMNNTGMTQIQARQHGRRVKETIKGYAATATPGKLRVTEVKYASLKKETISPSKEAPAPKADGTQGKDIEETRESKLNREAMDAIAAIPAEELAKNPTLAAFDAVSPLYNQMEALKHRSALSQENQAYSTPSPLAALITAILDNVAAVVDPTGGNGGLFIAIGADGKHPKVVANELDKGRAERLEGLINERFGQTGNVTQGDYKSKEFQSILKELSKEGKVAYLLNPPFGAKTKDGYKLEHSIALNTIKDAKVGDTMFFIGAAPGRDVMSMDAGRLAGKYTTGNFAKFHSELNRQGWKPIIHFIADGNLYKKMGASFPVEVMLMEKTDGKIEDLHRPMRDAPGRYATWEQVREAVAERTTLDKDGKNTGPRYRLFDNDDVEMGIANPDYRFGTNPVRHGYGVKRSME